MARRDGAGVRLITRQGNDFTSRFPLVVAAVALLPSRSFLIDGEAIVTNNDGLAVFDLIRQQRHGENAVMVAFDLIELDGHDLRRTPIDNGLAGRTRFRSPPRLILEIDAGERLSAPVADDKTCVLFLNGPRRREAASRTNLAGCTPGPASIKLSVCAGRAP
jgi:hypothetical protein